MEKAICTVIITVASIAAIITVLNALMPAVSRTNSAIVASADTVDSRDGDRCGRPTSDPVINSASGLVQGQPAGAATRKGLR